MMLIKPQTRLSNIARACADASFGIITLPPPDPGWSLTLLTTRTRFFTVYGFKACRPACLQTSSPA